jgi:predicted lactoylglutathione lyase
MMAMEPRLTLVTLGVADLGRSRGFYEALGFEPCGFQNPDVAFYEAGGVVLALWSRQSLAEDAGIPEGGSGFRGISLAHNTRSESEVDAVLAHAVRSGAKLIKAAKKVFWGGYSGYFADPDGHLWEVAYNPGFPLDAAGHLQLPSKAK